VFGAVAEETGFITKQYWSREKEAKE